MNDSARFLFRRKVNSPLRRVKAKVHLSENLPLAERISRAEPCLGTPPGGNFWGSVKESAFTRNHSSNPKSK